MLFEDIFLAKSANSASEIAGEKYDSVIDIFKSMYNAPTLFLYFEIKSSS